MPKLTQSNQVPEACGIHMCGCHRDGAVDHKRELVAITQPTQRGLPDAELHVHDTATSHSKRTVD